jgi:putative heme-binding domain-containing protein
MTKTGGGRMPRLGSEEVDEAAVRLIREWISQMTDGSPSLPTDGLPPEEAAAYLILTQGSENGRADAIRTLTASTRGALALHSVMADESTSAELRADVLAVVEQHPQPEVRDLFDRFLPASRRARRLGTAVDAATLLALPADAARGRMVFFGEGATSCKSCHKVHDQGTALGPDLSEIGTKYAPRDLLVHLLEPSRFIDPKFVTYVVETRDGLVISGLLIEQADAEVVLKTAQNEERRIPTDDVETIVPQQKSLMPDLLLRDLTPLQAADLLAFLSSLK